MQVTRASFIPLLAPASGEHFEPGTLRDSFCGDLSVVYTFGPQFGQRVVTHADLGQLKMSPQVLRRSALDHLEVLAGRAKFCGQPPAIMLSFEGLESSLLLATDFWERLQGSVPGELVAGVPARDVVIVTGSRSGLGLEKARRAIDRVFFAGDDYLLTRSLLVRRGAAWEPFDQPAARADGSPGHHTTRHHGPAHRHGQGQQPRQYQEHPSWPGERVPVAPNRPVSPVDTGVPASYGQAGYGQAAYHAGYGQAGYQPGYGQTGYQPSIGQAGYGQTPPSQSGYRQANHGQADHGKAETSTPAAPADPSVSYPKNSPYAPSPFVLRSPPPTSPVTSTGTIPAVPPEPQAGLQASIPHDYAEYAAEVAQHSAVPYSSVPYSATPYSATPYSAAPYSAAPYSPAPHSPVPYGEPGRSRGANAAARAGYARRGPASRPAYPDVMYSTSSHLRPLYPPDGRYPTEMPVSAAPQSYPPYSTDVYPAGAYTPDPYAADDYRVESAQMAYPVSWAGAPAAPATPTTRPGWDGRGGPRARFAARS